MDVRHLWFALRDWRGEDPEGYFGKLGQWAKQRLEEITEERTAKESIAKSERSNAEVNGEMGKPVKQGPEEITEERTETKSISKPKRISAKVDEEVEKPAKRPKRAVKAC